MADHIGVALLAIPVTLAARWVSVSIPITILSRWSSFSKGAIPILTWGGLRGGIAVALALSLPANQYKPTILTITYAVVLFSIIVQGLTIKPLVEHIASREKSGGTGCLNRVSDRYAVSNSFAVCDFASWSFCLRHCSSAMAVADTKNGFVLDDASVPPEEILHGGPAKDGIRSLEYPAFVTAGDAGFLRVKRPGPRH